MTILLMLLMVSSGFAHEEEGGGPSVGVGKGVEAYSEHDGFVLSKEAFKRFGVETTELSGACDLKKVQVISALEHKEVFVLRNSHFKSIEPKCSELKAGDRGVVKGAEFLRVVEMDLTSIEDEHVDDDASKSSDSGKHKAAQNDK